MNNTLNQYNNQYQPNQPIQPPVQEIVIAEKMMHKGAMFGHVSNGGGIISLGNGKSIKFIAVNEQYVTIQIIESGIGVPVKTQSWQKTKTVIEKAPPKPKKQPNEQVQLKDEKEIEEVDLL